MIYDLFSGIRGWELGFEFPPLSLGIEKDHDAFLTASHHGFETLKVDINQLDYRDLPSADGIVGSPPCVPFSAAGLGEGRSLLSLVIQHLDDLFVPNGIYFPSLPQEVALVIEPARWIKWHRPYFVALEQVPSVLPVWKEYERHLRRYGYSTWSGILHAESFGFGTNRKRAFLLASRQRSVGPPIGSYSRFYPHRPNVRDEGFSRPLSMADVLGWGMTRRPAPTVTAGGTSTGGAEPFGNGARKMMEKEWLMGYWTGPRKTRPSVEDVKLLHGLPQDFYIAGKLGSQYRQLGNMVIPGLGRKVLECVM